MRRETALEQEVAALAAENEKLRQSLHEHQAAAKVETPGWRGCHGRSGGCPWHPVGANGRASSWQRERWLGLDRDRG